MIVKEQVKQLNLNTRSVINMFCLNNATIICNYLKILYITHLSSIICGFDMPIEVVLIKRLL
jgi:hypothetical protein